MWLEENRYVVPFVRAYLGIEQSLSEAQSGPSPEAQVLNPLALESFRHLFKRRWLLLKNELPILQLHQCPFLLLLRF